MSDYQRDRIRRDERGVRTPAVGPGSAGAVQWLGTVTSTGTLATRKFFWVDRKAVAGDEVAGGAARVSAAPGRVPVYFTGPRAPITGEDYVVRWVRDRWVARTGKAPAPPIEKCNVLLWPDVAFVTCDGHTVQVNRYFSTPRWIGEVSVDWDCVHATYCNPMTTTTLRVSIGCTGAFAFFCEYEFGIGKRQCNGGSDNPYYTELYRTSADLAKGAITSFQNTPLAGTGTFPAGASLAGPWANKPFTVSM